MEPNEEIVRRYFELHGYFVRSRVSYRVPNGYSDIDLLVLHPDGRAGAVEVKGWHTEAITMNSFKDWPIWNFLGVAADEAIHAALGPSQVVERYLVVGRIGSRSRGDVLEEASRRGVKIIEFTEILSFLIGSVSRNENAASDAEHAIRLLLSYGFLPGSPTTS